MKAREIIVTSSGWLLEVGEVRWWDEDDGVVYGRAFKDCRHGWSQEKYLGTVKGLREMAVPRLRLVS